VVRLLQRSGGRRHKLRLYNISTMHGHRARARQLLPAKYAIPVSTGAASTEEAARALSILNVLRVNWTATTKLREAANRRPVHLFVFAHLFPAGSETLGHALCAASRITYSARGRTTIGATPLFATSAALCRCRRQSTGQSDCDYYEKSSQHFAFPVVRPFCIAPFVSPHWPLLRTRKD
jgi:hypothetical protein